MHTYAERVFVDVATGRPLVGIRATLEDAETGAPVQAYRDGAPVTLVSGTHGVIDEFQTEDTTRRVRVTVGSRSLSSWCLEAIAEASAAGTRLADLEAQPAIPAGGLAGDFLTRTAFGYSWTPPLYDDGGTVADLSGLYFIDNGDGTVTPAHPTSYTDDGGTITMKGA